MVDPDTSSNCYVTLAYADTYLTRFGGTTWTDSVPTDAVKIAALEEATREIDSLQLAGKRYEPPYIENGVQADYNGDGLVQILEFPRIIDNSYVDYDYATDLPVVPIAVKEATALEALAIVTFNADTDNTDRKSMKEQGVLNYSLGGVYSESLGQSHYEKTGLYSPAAYRKMKPYLARSVDIR